MTQTEAPFAPAEVVETDPPLAMRIVNTLPLQVYHGYVKRSKFLPIKNRGERRLGISLFTKRNQSRIGITKSDEEVKSKGNA